MSRSPKLPPIKRTLFIIDLRETIVDERSVMVESSYEQNLSVIRNYNRNDLVFNLCTAWNTGPYHHSLAVYQPNLMQFIAAVQQKRVIDVMLYSNSLSWLVIYHAIVIEIYFNYAYSTNHYLKSAASPPKLFGFKLVIGRESGVGITLKNLQSVMGAMDGFVKTYSKVILVDDLNRAWEQILPAQFYLVDIRVGGIMVDPCFLLFDTQMVVGRDVTYDQILEIRQGHQLFVALESVVRHPYRYRLWDYKSTKRDLNGTPIISWFCCSET